MCDVIIEQPLDFEQANVGFGCFYCRRWSVISIADFEQVFVDLEAIPGLE